MGNKNRAISKAEYDRMNAAREQAEKSGQFGIAEPNTNGATLAAIGGMYQIGNIMVPQFGLDTIALLSIANVNILDAGSETPGEAMRDISLALYIVANGAEACHMLMGVQQRIRAIERLEGLAGKSPEMFERYMNKIDEIGGGVFAEIEQRAIEFMASIHGVTIDEIADTIGQMADDFSVVMGLLPDSGDNSKKK